jgi:glycosyltransferase involved in cell wall biosynthesis
LLSADRTLSRLVAVVAREGILEPARRKVTRAINRRAERLQIQRFAGVPWKADGRPVFLLITHNKGGGTERHVRDLAEALREVGVRPVVAQPSARGGILWLVTDDGERISWCRESNSEPAAIEDVLELLRPIHAHFHHLMDLPENLVNLLQKRGVPYDWTIHDYYTVCPRVNLIGEGGRYCGEPDAEGCNGCLARLGDDQGRPVSGSISAWRARAGRCLLGARRVFVPSDDASRRIQRYYPDVNIQLRPHPESLRDGESLAARWAHGETARVALIGTIVRIKGSDRLLDCARDALERRLPLEFHVIGTTDCNAALSRVGNVHITGRYRQDEVYHRLGAVRPHLAFLPSECPETFMFALSTAMEARLFAVCFNLGAQAQRVLSWGWGEVLDHDVGAGEVNDALLAAARRLATAAAAPPAPPAATYDGVLTSYYEFSPAEVDRLGKTVARPAERPDQPLHILRRKDNAHIY